MDEIDFKIIQLLESNGRLSHAELAKLISISRPAVYQRISKLEKKGIITGYKALIDWYQIEPFTRCLIFIKLNGRNFDALAKSILAISIPDIVIETYHRLAGEWCILLQIRMLKTTDTTKILDEIWQLEGILETSTTFILDSKML